MKLSIIIPVFNEEKSIVSILKQVQEVRIPNVTKEIIIVDDGSRDNTANIIKDYVYRKHQNEINLFTHTVNKGKGAAIITGIKEAKGDYIIIQDADMEYDPSYIKKLVDPILNKKAQVVYGTRLNRLPHFKNEEKEPLFILHYLGNRFLSFITSMLYGQWITDMETCYKLFPKDVVDSLHLSAKGFDFEPEITAKLLKKGYKIIEIPIVTKPRGYQEGKKLNALHEGPRALWVLCKYRFVD